MRPDLQRRMTVRCTPDWVCTRDVGDGGPATAAELNVPIGVAATHDGGFLIAYARNNRVRLVDADFR